MPGKHSRAKGAGYEREIANFLKSYGYDAKRSGQYQSQSSDAAPDVSGFPPFWVECKRMKRIVIHGWMQQAIESSQPADIPIVICRGDGKSSLVVIDLEDFMDAIEGEDNADR